MNQRRRPARPPRDPRQDAVIEPMESVEARVQETVNGAMATVDSVMEGLKRRQATVDGAKAAVEELLERVNGALKETIDCVKTVGERIEPAQLQEHPWALVKATAELIESAHVSRNPWLLLGSAIVMGYLFGTHERHTASTPRPGGSSAERHEPRDP